MSNVVRGLLVACAMGLSASGFAAEGSPLLKGDAKAGEGKAAGCAACHGPKGNSATPAWPKLAGQSAVYTYEQLKHFKDGSRKNGLMAPMAAPLSEQDMIDLALFFATQPASPGVASESSVAVAETIYRAGIADRGIPACSACHGPTGAGNPAAGYPRLGGQHAEYNSLQLNAYRAGERKQGAKGLMMSQVAADLTDEEIAALASYINGLQ